MSLRPAPLRNPAVPEPPIRVEAAGPSVFVPIRRSSRAKSLALRATKDGVVATAPVSVTRASVERFVLAHAGWIAARLAQSTAPIRLDPGAVVPVFGEDRVVCVRPPDGRARVLLEDKRISVAADVRSSARVPRLVEGFLIDLAGKALKERADIHASSLGAAYTALSVKDVSSRWGSCSSDKRLAFSWRLVLAPPRILDYVAAHECAHLLEMNHGPRFWRLVRSLAGDPAPARSWLKRHGKALHAYTASLPSAS